MSFTTKKVSELDVWNVPLTETDMAVVLVEAAPGEFRLRRVPGALFKGVQGEKGAKGDAGVAGAQGEKGDQGDPGAPGAKGDKGDAGDAGPAGATGPKGDIGDTGPAWSPTHSVLAYGATVTPDFDGDDYRTVTLAGNIDFTASANRGAGKSVVIRVIGDASERTLAFNASWKFYGAKPATLAANKEAVLSLSCFGANETDVRAAWAVEE